MKKKLLTTMLALVMSASVTTAMVGCDNGDDGHTHTFASEWTADDTYHWHAATCEHTTEVSDKAAHNFENDVCTVCQKIKPAVEPVYTVTEEEWVSFFNTVDSGNYYFEADVTVGENEMTMVVANKDNLFCLTSDFEKGYVSFDDANSAYAMYFFENNDWGSYAKTCSAGEYATTKAQYCFTGVVLTEFLGSVDPNGEIAGLDEIYSAFTYGDGVYSTTMYLNNDPNQSIQWRIGFENGKMVSLNIVQGSAGSLTGTIVYEGFEVVIPDEALNAGSQN